MRSIPGRPPRRVLAVAALAAAVLTGLAGCSDTTRAPGTVPGERTPLPSRLQPSAPGSGEDPSEGPAGPGPAPVLGARPDFADPARFGDGWSDGNSTPALVATEEGLLSSWSSDCPLPELPPRLTTFAQSAVYGNRTATIVEMDLGDPDAAEDFFQTVINALESCLAEEQGLSDLTRIDDRALLWGRATGSGTGSFLTVLRTDSLVTVRVPTAIDVRPLTVDTTPRLVRLIREAEEG